jgi:uncharacterized membrane protein
MGLLILICGLVVFLGTHLVVTMRDVRAGLIARIGKGTYKGLFSILAALGLGLIVWGFARYRAAEWIDVWYPPVWTRHVTIALMLPSVILMVAGYIRGRIYATLKHPFLAGVKLWAAAHLIANGDLGSILLFGTVLAWAVIDRISLKSRTDPGAPPIPVGTWRSDVLAIVVGVLVYLALGFVFHPLIIGVPVFVR